MTWLIITVAVVGIILAVVLTCDEMRMDEAEWRIWQIHKKRIARLRDKNRAR